MDIGAPVVDPVSIVGFASCGFNIYFLLDYEFRKAQALVLLNT
jgi:hypothetical protein